MHVDGQESKPALAFLVLVNSQEGIFLHAMVTPGTGTFMCPSRHSTCLFIFFCSEKYSFGPTRIRTLDLLINRQESWTHSTTEADYVRFRNYSGESKKLQVSLFGHLLFSCSNIM